MAVNSENPDTPDAPDDPTAVRERYALRCGRSVEEVAEEVGSGRYGPHTLDCPHCSTARASLEQLAEATRELIDDPVPTPAGLFDRILDAVRADLVSSSTIPLPAPGGGVDVSTHALAAVLRYAADTVDDVRAHRCRIEPVAEDPGSVRVWMSLSLRYTGGRIDALDVVRERVRTALSERIGLGLAGLDLELVDLWVEGPATGPGEGEPR